MYPKILIVEDEKLIRENMREILLMHAYEVETACDGEEGLSKVPLYEPDLVLCDILMPKLNGFGFVEALRKNLNRHDIPVILISALSDNADIRKGMSLGVDDYISKPFKMVDLLQAIEVRLKKKMDELNYYTANKQIPYFNDQEEHQAVKSALKLISSAEKKVLYCLANNLSSAEMAKQLNLSIRTVQNHRANMIRKINRELNMKLYEFAIKVKQFGILNDFIAN